MKTNIGYDENNRLEITPSFVIHNTKGIANSVEVEGKKFEHCLNCPVEEREKIIKEILEKIGIILN